jgi:hypothetical protein
MIKLVTFVARAEPDVEVEWVLRESDRPLMVASPALFPNDSFHRLGFFVTVGDAGAGAGAGGRGGSGTSRKEGVEMVVDRVWRLSSRTSV